MQHVVFLLAPLCLQATLAAANVAACVQGMPAFNKPDITPFLESPIASLPQAAPSIVNAKEIGLAHL
jgi:hydroxypyruvate reductase 1